MIGKINIKTETYNLFEVWCNKLLELQVPQGVDSLTAGGIMCPACGRIHGRTGEAVFPFMRMAHMSGKTEWIEAAVNVQKWSDNMNCADGAWWNDRQKVWKGTSIFGANALVEALKYNEMLSSEISEKWKNRLFQAVEFVYKDYKYGGSGNINYPAAAAVTMAHAYRIFGDEKYKKQAGWLADYCCSNFISEDNLLFGEGNPRDYVSDKGCRNIDLGYNVEESIPALAYYAKLMNDDKIAEAVLEMAQEHLEFMLPDGGIDNSWGNRNFKWSWWGSRTSDGCQHGYLILSAKDDVFAVAAKRNLELYERCTHNGLLFGGPHFYDNGYKPCVHHTLFHAKVLASVLEYFEENRNFQECSEVGLPCEKNRKYKYWKSIDTHRINANGWLATITGNDTVYDGVNGHATGGALSLLYHKKIGSICTASLNDYVCIESENQQLHKGKTYPLTPRMEYVHNMELFSSNNDYCAELCKTGDTEVTVCGNLQHVDMEYEAPKQMPFRITYTANEIFKISAECSDDGARFVLPIIFDIDDKYEISENNSIIFTKDCSSFQVQAEKGKLSAGEPFFNLVPGFRALPVKIESENGEIEIIIYLA
jgi:hypothetical protein